MSSCGEDLASLERTKRRVLRSLAALKDQIDSALVQEPSADLAQKIRALIDEARSALSKLEIVTDQILDAMDMSALQPEQVAQNETKIGAELIKYETSLAIARGQLNALCARLEPSMPVSRRSLDTSFIAEGAPSNPLVKLPDIPVPKFDGKIKNFTEWHSLFAAMIDSNEKLKPVQKLYYLKQAMTGDAENVLKDYALQENLYEPAFKYVKERYFNKRVIIASHFRDLLDLPPMKLSSLRESLDQIGANIRGLKVCDINTAQMSPFISYIIARKLPDKLRTDWENSNLDYTAYPGYELLENFLQNRCFSYESIRSEANIEPVALGANEKQRLKSKGKTSSFATTVSNPYSNIVHRRCVLCGREHYLSQCNGFIQKSVTDRYAVVREKGLCANCLRRGHVAAECNSSRCTKCAKNHNTLLHQENSRGASVDVGTSKAEIDRVISQQSKASLALVSRKQRIILLPSAVVNVRIGTFHVKARALIDACSQVNLVSENFVLKHGIQSKGSLISISGVNPSDLESTSSVSLRLVSRISDFSIEIDACVVGRIPYEVFDDTIAQVADLSRDLPLADCSLRSPNVDILIGGQFANLILSGNKKVVNDLVLEETPFGWTAAGPLVRRATPDNRCCHLTVEVKDALTKFWEVEEVDAPNPAHSEHELCEAHFESTHTRLSDGRFQVRLPTKMPAWSLANTYQQARAALLRHERKSDTSTRALYVNFMTEYQDLRHMEPSPRSEAHQYFIPHLPVLRPDSSTTKLRVVFNASAKNQSGISLNEALMSGPTIQPELFDILLRFRTYSIAFSADISKMYRQVSVHPDDRHLQTILWRNHPNDEIEKFQLTTLTYGTTPASFIATKCLQVIAKSVPKNQPEVARAISSEFYMDDLLTGAHSVADGIKKRESIQSMLDSAQLPLRKYVSNSEEFLASLDKSLVENLRPLEFSSGGMARILGLQWQPSSDRFSINVKLVELGSQPLTKRVIASLASRIYDPLGFVSPVSIRAKILLQDLWREGKGWDDPSSPEISSTFRNYYSELSSLPQFTVSRHYCRNFSPDFDLIGFCDASHRAYGAVIYLRANGQTALICSKTKVAPLKALTIPRLELLGTVLLSKLLARVSKVLQYDISKAIAHCDSTISLAWLKGPSAKYQTFVRNRVDFVNSILPFRQWRYVKTNDNPADLLTRGISVKALIANTLWVHGPVWLSQKNGDQPALQLTEEVPETRACCNVAVDELKFEESFIARYSSLEELLRITAHMAAFVSRVSPVLEKYKPLESRTRASYILYHVSQLCFFRYEIASLKNSGTLPPRSSLRSLSPFLDAYGLLRVGGRLQNSQLSYETKHPIILARHSVLAELIIRHVHGKYFHATRSFTLAFLQRRFWIYGGASRLVKKVVAQCVWCTRIKAESASQIMGNLPRERISIARPFSYVGVDFAGPFETKCTNHRSTKHLKYYAAFFVCLTTRAVHLEAVSDLSTAAFIAALQRFSARRGVPHTIWTDNATNFVGARNVLERHCASTGIKWKFIPPRSPHQGGIWESAVKAGKKYLLGSSKGLVSDAEQFMTTLSKIEAIMNSRPLYQKRSSADPDVLNVITPGHFLVGSNLLEPSDPDTISLPLSARLDHQKAVISSFWQQWSKFYLAQLQTRPKWKTAKSNLNVGDIVLLKDDLSPSIRWPLGRVTAVFPDSQNRVRLVTVLSKGSSFQRSIQRLIKLPVEP